MGKSTLCSRAAVALAGLVAVVGLAACVPVSEPPPPPQPTYEFSGMSVMSSDKSVALRNLYVADPGPNGYQPGGVAPLAVQVWNNTTGPISLVSATASGTVPVVLVGGATADPGGSAVPALETFDVLVGPGANVPLSQEVGRYLQIGCLSAALTTGSLVEMTFTFSNGATITTKVPVGGQLAGAAAEPVALTADGC